MRLGFTSPCNQGTWTGHGFVGAWARHQPLQVHGTGTENSRHGPNWFMQAALEPDAGERIHVADRGDIVVAFDGYVADPPLHQRSPGSAIVNFWRQHRQVCVNGLFSAAIFDAQSSTLTLRTDAFGFAPLYYRDIGAAILFATQADWLVSPDTVRDDISLASVIGNDYIVGDRSLYQGIHRAPLGGCITFTADTAPATVIRHDRQATGSADQPATADRLDHVNDCFRQAVERCLALDHGPTTLALSSGLDSRRILGALLKKNIRPPAFTVRLLQKGDRDLDAPVATAIADHAGLVHRVVELPAPAVYARDCMLRQRLIGGETTAHDWGITLQRSYPDHVATVFNGFLGDTVDDSRHPWDNMFEDPQRDLELFAAEHGRMSGRSLLAPALDRGDEVVQVVREYLAPYADLRHAADLAEMVLQMRRGNAISTQLLRPRHLEVKPFVDLDYIRAVNDIEPQAKIDSGFRRDLLARYHPDLAGFSGTADHADVVLRSRQQSRLQRTRARACVAALARDVPLRIQQRVFRHALSARGRALVHATRHFPAATHRWNWFLRPALEAVLHPPRVHPVWDLPATPKPIPPHGRRSTDHAAHHAPA